MSKNLKESLIEQQDLYGAPPFMDEPINSEPIQALYGVPSPRIGDPSQIITAPVLYGPPSPTPKSANTTGKVAVGGTGIFLSMILFVVGLIAMFNKKIPTFAKVIIGVCAFIVIAVIIALTVGIINVL